MRPGMIMKFLKLLVLLFLMMAFRSEAQTQIITAQVTITNIATNASSCTFSVNGHSRTWETIVTSPNNQLLWTNSILATATNLFYAYITYPETSPYLQVQMIASNVIQFQTTVPQSSPALVISTNGYLGQTNWVYWTYATNTLTNAWVVRLPTNAIGAIERMDDQNGFVSLFDDLGMTNFFDQSKPAWREFLGTNFGAGITNWVLTNLLATSNALLLTSSNYTWVQGSDSTNFTYQWAGILATNNTNFTESIGLSITNWALATFLTSSTLTPPWQQSGGEPTPNILLTNGYGTERYGAQANGGAIGGQSYLFESDGITLWLENDGVEDTLIKDRTGGNRVEIDGFASGSSNSYIRGGMGLNLGNNGPAVGSGPAVGAGVAVGGEQGTVFAGRPIVFQNVTCPAVAVGTITNFASVGVTSDTIYNTFSVAGDTMTNNGDSMIRDIGMTFVTGSGYSVDVEFNGQVIFASGSFNAISGAMSLRCEVTTDASGNYHYNSSGSGSGLTTNTFSVVGHHAWDTGTATNFYINVIADVGTDNIEVETDNTLLCPGGKWNSLP